MPSRAAYAPLPSAHETAEAAERQMEDAFDLSDDDDDDHGRPEETRPMIPAASATARGPASPSDDHSPSNNLYNFEYDYTMPPPGSPPRPSALAIPGNIFGNTNGYLPVAEEVIRPAPARDGWVRRNLGRLFSQESDTRRPIGGGTNNDGVFANVVAKPTAPSTTNNLSNAEEGSSNVHVAPEFEQKDAPPTYADAQQDAVPPYWDTTVLAPANMGDELIIEGMAPGHVFSFITSFFISFSFQFIGFMLTSILAATHAAKFGSRAGLGITLVQYGFYLRSNLRDAQLAAQNDVNGWAIGSEPHPTFASPQEADDYYATRVSPAAPTGSFPEIPSLSNGDYSIPQEVTVATDWLSFFLMTMGWLIFLTSLLGFYRVKRWERSLRQSAIHNTVMSTSEFERPLFRTLRQGPFRDMGRIFARLPPGEEFSNRRTMENAQSEPEPTESEPQPPTDPEERQRWEAARQIDRRIEHELRRAGLL